MQGTKFCEEGISFLKSLSGEQFLDAADFIF